MTHTTRLLIAEVVLLLLSLAVAAVASGAEPKPLEYAAGPHDWTGWALADLVTLPEQERPFTRYIAIPHWGSDKWVPAINYANNTSISHARVIQLGQPIANGWMLRVNLAKLVPDRTRLAKTIATWDGLASKDPYLHIPEQNSGVNLAVLAPVIDPEQAKVLAGLTLSVGAVYRADWLLAQMLDTIDGRQYYEFRQVNRKPEKGSGLDNWLTERGVFLATTSKAGGERRFAMLTSDVAAYKPRRGDIVPTLSGGICSITYDNFDADRDAKKHPIRNLLEFQHDGSEIIASLPNGMLDYLLADGQGGIVDEAPPNLVRDHTIPAPHTARLRPAISCISCHSIESEDGWRKVRNDVLSAIQRGRLNVFADFGDLKLTSEEVVDKLAGLYALDVENADGILARARRDHNNAVALCSKGIPLDPDKSPAVQIGQLTTSIIHGYDYQLVTPRVAAMELGYRVPEGYVGNPLDEVLGPIGAADEVREADPIIGFLRDGVSVNRVDFEGVYQDLLLMAEARRKAK